MANMSIERKAELFENVIDYTAKQDDETAINFFGSLGMTTEEMIENADGYYADMLSEQIRKEKQTEVKI